MVIAIVAAVIAGVTSCSGASEPDGIDYVTDATLSTYNSASTAGSSGGALMAFTRTLGGFSYLGPDGRVVADPDVGTATVVPGDPDRLVVRYDVNPAATFSDGSALDCDDLVLAWAANSGRFPGFAPATTAGYRDIDTVDCADGQRSATVTFAADRPYRDWAALFGAGTLMPAHVAARAAGVGSVISPIRARSTGPLGAIARFWNTGWDLKAGSVDEKLFPSAGPYRLTSVTRDGAVQLEANPRWWGEAPQEKAITVWPRGSAGSSVLADDDAEVVDVATGTYESTDGASTSTTTPTVGQPATQQDPGPAVDQLVFATTGVFADPATRRAVAACVPRDRLAADFGYGADPWNLHLIGPGDVAAAELNAQYGSDFARVDIPRARGALGREITVRIGFVEPDARRAAMIAAIAESCSAAGVRVQAVPQARPTFDAGVDALVLTTGSSTAASGALDPTRDSYAFVAGDPADIDRFVDPQVSAAINRLAVSDDEELRLNLVRSVENALWTKLPALPLFATPRTRGGSAEMTAAVPGVARSGTGWNMDRWSRN
ncbi:ABC transporter substrate-binding protein [Williamsia maris]|uniref:Peptide/nickel transport system substrate-binding protein n=1 Tax=Williamsia maris TaxID=72806 RepID=A0ABT1HKD6_9NOCA|nr:ABC transporter substrate-binding protein [Williamsia maris]MCP2178393.1 peptide/nickel transport system substrate-binding protein [Williamsia maris]